MGRKMNWESEADFCIRIDFEKNSRGNPARIFEAMSGLIRCFQSLDESLVECIDINKEVCTELILTDIKTGSLLTWLRTFISDIDDSELMEHGWKALLDFYEHASTSVYALTEKNEVKYITPEEETAISKTCEISEEIREEILTKESSTSQHDLILPVKKPDYLGQSKWELKYQGHTIEAAIEDNQWLSTFQQGLIRLSPGDSLSARVEFEVKEAFDTGESLVHYHILKVKDVMRAHKQKNLFPDNDAQNVKDQ